MPHIRRAGYQCRDGRCDPSSERVADRIGADLGRVDLSSSELHGASFQGANLERANLSSSELIGANLLGAIAGGIVEYLSLVTGFRFLLVVVAALYASAFLFGRQHLTPARA